MALKIRVISLNGKPLSIGQVLLRWVLRIVDIQVSSGIAASMSLLIGQQGQRIGDIAANCAVIMDTTKKNDDPSAVDFTHDITYTPQILAEKTLSNEEYSAIEKLLIFRANKGDFILSKKEASKILELLKSRHSLTTKGKRYKHDLDILRTIARDYRYFKANENIAE